MVGPSTTPRRIDGTPPAYARFRFPADNTITRKAAQSSMKGG